MESESIVNRESTVSAIAELPTIDLVGIRIHALTEAESISHILDELRAGRGGWVATPNLDHLRRLWRDDSFRELCAHANLLVPDGMPLLWASRLQRTPLPGRVAGSDLISSLSSAAGKSGHTVFLLGGDPGTAEAAAQTLQQKIPELQVAGASCPPIGFEKDEAAMQRLAAELRAAKPDIVFVALGSPKQERLMEALRGELPDAWWLGVGISFSFLSGAVKRAPIWMQRAGLEWLHRLVQEPRRMAARYLAYGLPFALILFANAAWRGATRSGRES